jgi:hypothetical protein
VNQASIRDAQPDPDLCCACGPVILFTNPTRDLSNTFISNDNNLPIWTTTGLHIGGYAKINWPSTPAHGNIGEVLSSSKAGRIRLLPAFSDQLLTPEVRRLMVVTGIWPSHLQPYTGHQLPITPDAGESPTVSANFVQQNSATPRTSISYELRAIADSGAGGYGAFVPASLLNKGSARILKHPVPVEVATGKTVMATVEGEVDLASNVKPGTFVTITGLATPGFSRVIVSLSAFDDAGYYTDLGGGGCRVRKGPHGETLLALPRVQQNNHGDLVWPTLATTKAWPSQGPINFNLPLQDRQSLYPIPDQCFPQYKPLKTTRQTSQDARTTVNVVRTQHFTSEASPEYPDPLGSSDTTLVSRALHARSHHLSYSAIDMLQRWDGCRHLSADRGGGGVVPGMPLLQTTQTNLNYPEHQTAH